MDRFLLEEGEEQSMPGFLISNIEHKTILNNYDKSSCVSDYYRYKEFTIGRLTLEKFMLA